MVGSLKVHKRLAGNYDFDHIDNDDYCGTDDNVTNDDGFGDEEEYDYKSIVLLYQYVNKIKFSYSETYHT